MSLCVFPFIYLGVAYNGVDQIHVEGKEVLVIGCGAIGLFAIAVAKAKGMNYYTTNLSPY